MNLNTIVMSICSFIMVAAITWVGRGVSSTHDSVIRLETNADAMKTNVADIRATMLTRSDLSIELLKLQIPIPGKSSATERKP